MTPARDPGTTAGLLLATLVWLLCTAGPTPQLDDAYIFHRTASHLAHGQGLVFNPGEYVEGVSSLTWTAAIALGVRGGFEAPGVAHWLGVVSGLLALLGAAALAGAPGLRAPRLLALGPVVLLLASTPFVRWAPSGMETLANAALVTWTLAAFAHARIAWATALAVLATLTRMDAGLVAAVVLGSYALRHGRRDPRALLPAVVFAGALGVLTLWRLWYFGDPLPNTFYAKVGDTSWAFGLRYVATFLRDGVAFWIPAFACAALLDRRSRPAVVWVVLHGLYVASVGGDAFGHSRHLVVALPALAAVSLRGVVAGFERSRRLGVVLAVLTGTGGAWQVWGADAWPLLGTAALAALGLAAVRARGRPRAVVSAVVLGGLAAGAFAAAEPGAWQRLGAQSKRGVGLRWAFEADRRLEQRSLERVALLRERVAAGERVRLLGATGIGSIGYYSGLPILDLLGLVDRTIARSRGPAEVSQLPIPGHTRSDAGYVLQRRPDYLLMERKREGVPLLRAHWDLWQHADLERLYEWDPAMGGYRLRDPVRQERSSAGPRAPLDRGQRP